MEILLKMEPAEQERQRRAQIIALLDSRLLDAWGIGKDHVNEFAIGQEQLSRRSGVLPAHASGLTQEQRSGLGLPGLPLRRISFTEGKLQGLSVIIMILYGFENLRQAGIGGKRRTASQPHQWRQSLHKRIDAPMGLNVEDSGYLNALVVPEVYGW